MKSERFTYTANDLREVTRLRIRPPEWWMLAYFAAVIVPGVVIGLGAALIFPTLETATVFLIAVAVAWIALFVARPIYQQRVYAWTTQNAPTLNSPGVVTTDADGFRWESGVSRSWTSWKSVLAIKRGKTGVFFFTQPNAAFCVPDRAFATDEARAAFIATATASWEAARQTETPQS